MENPDTERNQTFPVIHQTVFHMNPKPNGDFTEPKIILCILLALLFLPLLSNLPLAYGASNTVTLYLHKASSVVAINTKSTAGQILNTTTSWSGSTQENASEIASGAYCTILFYLYPTLAGSLVFNGAPVVTAYFKGNDTVNDLTLVTTLSKVSGGGVVTDLSTQSNGGKAVGLGYGALTSTHGAVSATVTSSFSLQLNITLGGSGSNMTLTLGYDTLLVGSRMTLVATDPLVTTFAADKASYIENDDPVLTITVTDVFGGYDISAVPTITFSTPPATYTTSASSTGDTQYSNTYTYTVINVAQGTWSGTASVDDQSGNSYTGTESFIVEREPGGFNFDPQPNVLVSSDQTTTLAVVGIVIVGVAAVIFIAKSGKKKRRRR